MISDTERREIAQELRHYAVYGEDETLLGWWARLHFIATTFPTRARCSCALLG